MARKIHEACQPARWRGFTLIELIITIAVSMLLVGGAVAGYNSFNDTQVLKQAGLSLKNNLQFASVKAQAVDKPVSDCTELIGYRVTFTSSSYSIAAQCTEGALAMQTIALPSGFTFSPVPADITFVVLTRRLLSDTQTDIIIVGRSGSYILELNPNGNIVDLGVQ